MNEGGMRTSGICKLSSSELPLVSIITVVYNRKTFLEQTIRSVLDQTYGNIEYIIIDGGSTDGSLEIIKKYNDRIDYWLSEPDEGMYYALNKGIRCSSGEYVGICHSDDYFYNCDVVQQLARLLMVEDADICHGDMITLNSDGSFGNRIISEAGKITETNNGIIHPSAFIKKEMFTRFGLYDTSFKSASDYELMVRFYSNGCMFKHLDSIVTVMRVGNHGRISANCYGLLEDFRIHRKYKTGNSNRFLLKYLYCIIHSSAKRLNLTSGKTVNGLKKVLRNLLVKD
jgi:glycosyltransferase involved in cell wall biosynthesis